MSTSTNGTATQPYADRGDAWERRAGIGRIILLVMLLLQGLVFITESSQTSDEAVHLAAGYSYLTTGDFRLNPEHPPLIKEIAALPLLLFDVSFPQGDLWERAEEWNIGRLFVHENLLPNDTLLLLGRLPILLLSCALGWLLFHWSRLMFGPRGALVSLALYVFDPNVVTHSSLVTTDLGITLFIFLSVYALWSWSNRPSRSGVILLGAALGGTFAAKYTAVWILPILAGLGGALLLLGVPLPARPWAGDNSTTAIGGRFSAARIRSLAMTALLVAGIAVVVLGMTYGLGGFPSYFIGLKRTLAHSAAGHTAYLFGGFSENGWWYYFLVAWIMKTPPGTIIVVGLSLVALGAGLRRGARDEWFLYLPVLVLIGLTCIWKVNIGLRHLLPIYPFLYVGAGRLMLPWPAAGLKGRALAQLPLLVVLCLGWSAWESMRIAPYALTYFNAAAGGPANGHLRLLDSNLDWGQGAKTLRAWLDRHRVPAVYLAFAGNTDPWYYGVRYQYVPGSGNLESARERLYQVPEGIGRELLVVSPTVMHSAHFSDHTLYDWLSEREPIAAPGNAWLVYDITDDADMHANLAAVSLRFGDFSRAAVEAGRTLRIEPGHPLASRVLAELAGRSAGR